MALLRLASLALIVQTLAAQQTAPASVQGVIVRANGEEPVPGAKLELRPSTGASDSTVAISDEQGRFIFPKVAPGQYRLLASRTGYVPAESGQSFAGGPGLKLTVAASQRLQNVRIAMTPGGVITGRVLDRGKPAGNARVYAVKASYELGHRVTNVVLSGITNDLGEYRIFWLPPGRYYVQADVYDGTPPIAPVTTSIGDNDSQVNIVPQARLVFTRAISSVVSDTEKHVPTYHPGTPAFREARAIDVAPGSLIRGIDIHVSTVRVLHVRGAITGIPQGTNGQPLRPSTLLFPLDAGDTSPIARGSVELDGSFDIPGVKPGSYVLSSTAGNRRGWVPIDVLDRDVNGVRLELGRGLSMSGRISIEGGTTVNSLPATLFRISLLSESILGGFRENVSSAIQAGNVTPSADGSFTIPSSTTPGPLAGDYRVLVTPLLNPAAGWASPPALPANVTPTAIPAALQNAYVKSIRLGEIDVLHDGLRLTDSVRDPLVIVIGTNAGTIEGRVSNGEGRAAGAATVALLPEDNLRFRIAHKYAITDADGRFQLQGIAPGDYKLYAWEQIDSGAWQDPGFMRNYEASGKPIRVEEGSKATVEITPAIR